MPAKETCVDVVVVGGGPCGLFTGLLLARAGVRVTVIERHESLSSHPKAMGINLRTAEILRQAGLESEIAKGSLPLEGRLLALWSKGLSGEVLGRVPLTGASSAHTPCTRFHCPQTWTERTLLAALSQEALAEVHFGTGVSRVEDLGASVVARCSDGSLINGRYAVAADGARSAIRVDLGIPTDGPGDMGHFLNVFFRAPFGPGLTGREAMLYNALGSDFYEFFVAVDGNDHWLMHHFLMPGERLGEFDAERLRRMIARASGMPEVPVEILSVSPWVMSPKVAKRWRAGRIFLVGDAAARLSPAGGLGLNNGIQSAHNLAWKLASVIKGEATEALLDTYETERLPGAYRLMKSTNRNSDEIFTTIAAAMRGDWDSAKDLIARSRRAGAGLGIDLGIAYEEGAFLPDASTLQQPADVDNDYIPQARPGHRAPHAPTASGSLLDLMDGQFVVLAGKSGGAWRAKSSCAFYTNGAEFEAAEFETLYGIASSGCVLVRPDGYVGARFADAASAGSPANALLKILQRGG